MKYTAIKYIRCEDWRARGCYDVGCDVFGSKLDINFAFKAIEDYNAGRGGSCGNCKVEAKEIE